MSIAPVPEPSMLAFDPPANWAPLDVLNGPLHVWKIPAVYAAVDLAPLQSLLSTDEIARAHRFHFATHRDTFIVNRARLRILLAAYLACPPQQISFTYGSHGKPALSTPRSCGLNFNLSHTDGMAIVAIAHQRQLGVDVEMLHPLTDVLEIARQHFAGAEYEQLRLLQPSERLLGFYRCWTRKEAFLKATGEGLHRSLHEFQVSLLATEPAALIISGSGSEPATSWHLHSLDVGNRYIAALCHDGDIMTAAIRTFTWSHPATV